MITTSSSQSLSKHITRPEAEAIRVKSGIKVQPKQAQPSETQPSEHAPQTKTVTSLPFLTEHEAGPTPEFLEDLHQESQRLESATPAEIIAWAVGRYFPKLTMATAFGPEGCTILYMLSNIEPRTYIFNLDTGYQFQETLDLRDRIAKELGIEVELKRPELSVEQYERLHGGPVYKTNPNQCCYDRKVTVLREGVKGMNAWMSGIRRDQSEDRARTPIVMWDKKFQLVKISPLANWTKKEVWKLITEKNIPYNPLHDQGYPSIGCQPCTRIVQLGDDERAGRWSGTAKTECGLHTHEEEGGSGI